LGYLGLYIGLQDVEKGQLHKETSTWIMDHRFFFLFRALENLGTSTRLIFEDWDSLDTYWNTFDTCSRQTMKAQVVVDDNDWD